MKITFKLFATLTDYLPAEAQQTNRLELDIDPTTTIEDLAERFHLPGNLVHLVLVNGLYIEHEERARRTLQEGDTLAIWPPIAGG